MVQKSAWKAALAVGLLCGVAGAGVAHAEGMASASMLANTCDACHGPNGNSYGPASPSIAGMNEFYLTETMLRYASGDRPSTIMGRIARGYSEDEIKVIAKHFAAQKPARMIMQEGDAGLVDLGQKITRELCDSCHEDDGYAAEDYPILAGQMMTYLRYNLADFNSGARDLEKNPNLSNKERRKKIRNLQDMHDEFGEEGLEAVVHFYGSRK